MKVLLKRLLTMVMVVLVLLQTGTTLIAYASETADVKPVLTSSFDDMLNEKTAELAQNLAQSGIKKAIGKIPVIGGTVNSIAGPYIKKLLGIKQGESTNEKLDKINEKLDSLMKTVEVNSQTEMKKIYESNFEDFNKQLMSVRNKSGEYLTNISQYEEMSTSDEEKTLLIAGLTTNSGFDGYLDNVKSISQYVTGDVIELHQDGDIYTKAFKVYCADAVKADGCALGGEAAMLAAEYVNAINEIVDTAHTTAAMLLLARCGVGDNIADYTTLQSSGEITKDVSLSNFNKVNAGIYKNRYNDLKELHHDIFGVTEEDAAEAEEAGKSVETAPGAVGEYNHMIEDRWFDYIDSVDFSGNVPVIAFTPMDGEIGFASLPEYGFDKAIAEHLSEDSAVSYCKSLSKRILFSKHAALDDTRFNKLLKHIQTSEHFKHEKVFEGADYDEISLRDALALYGFSFAGLDGSGYSSSEYAKVFVTNAKCAEDYENTDQTHDGYIDGYVYGIDYNTITENINDKSAEQTYQYFKGHYSDHSADTKSANFPEFTVLYFQNTLTINSTSEFKDFIKDVAAGHNYASRTVILNCDVDLSQTDYLKLWPDSSRTKEFCGTFDGSGNTIRNFHVSGSGSRLALFRTTGEGATIKNLILDNVNVEGTAESAGCAALVGYANGSLDVNYVTVDSGRITGYKYVAGIVGETKEGKYVTTTLNKCDNYADITSTDTDAGGLVGNGAAVILEFCTNGGDITAQKGAAGGLVGYVGTKDTDPGVFAESCYNNGTVIGYDCAGGIFGHISSDNSGVILAMNGNTGDITVTAKHSAGGIVGRTCAGGVFSGNTNSGNIENRSTNDDAEAGGILGENEDDAITVTDNENTGNVTANKRVGGIAGTLGDRDHDKACTINHNSNSGTITSKAKDAGGIVGAVATDHTSHSIVGNSNTGAVEAQSEAGGIVGWMAGGGLFDSNTNRAQIVSVKLNAGGIVGRIQDDKCNFKNSSLGNAYAGTGSLSSGEIAGCDYYINAMNKEQHAGIICGWDGKIGKTINNDNLLASIFGEGHAVVIVALGIVLAAAVVIFTVVYKRKRKTTK